MNIEPIWIDEGFLLDDVGNLIVTTYVDLREEGKRMPILALVKRCKREHAIKDGKTILVAKPERFRDSGAALIRGEQEGLAKVESVTVTEATAADAAKQRMIADMNEAHELLNSRVRMVQREPRSSRKRKSQHLASGKEWLILSGAIRSEEAACKSWRGTLDEEYDHVSEIDQPAKFAQALGCMVTEQIGPQVKTGGSKTQRRGRKKHVRNTGRNGYSMGRWHTPIACMRPSCAIAIKG